MFSESKNVTAKSLRVGQQITGYKDGDWAHIFYATVKDIQPTYVAILRNGCNEIELISSDMTFTVDMSEDELEHKYLDGAKDVYKNIQTRLAAYEIGCHMMWNAWLGTPYEMAQHCKRGGFRIVGHCRDITPKKAWVTGDTLDVGICAEYENGERFWCHWKMTYLNEMVELYKDELCNEK